jgi:hypothetical protein
MLRAAQPCGSVWNASAPDNGHEEQWTAHSMQSSATRLLHARLGTRANFAIQAVSEAPAVTGVTAPLLTCGS